MALLASGNVSAAYIPDRDERGGFNFDNVARNEMMSQNGLKFKAAMKTGTTITGVCFKGGVVLGADTRSTNGETVADKNCEKIHYIAPNIYCCGAGTAADTEAVTGMIASALELHRLATKRKSRVVTALTMLKSHLFKYQGHVGAALVLGGVDINGPHLFSVHPHGSSDSLPFATMGSGSLAAMAVFEADFKEDMTEEEAKEIVARSIRAGIFNDLGSGSNVDLCVITADKVDYLRNYECPNERTYVRSKGYDFPPGTTVLNRRNFMTATAATLPVNQIVDIIDGAPEDVASGDAMQTD
ncbi:predicted protein [Micromonas commoda]|uniref:Proteasome subunit beta n=1 Tax=Micromonas commoda (strain RCC299 / NOUM17 / CCMP2709) TaxID=296587 RepID=C1EBX1_MICCC|nr:predicted protein [Micromonas commoda]ACO65793.1 predicted protein [Micromonas commoda]|eukprot:XP_002504535.1 predicted protein [Micromonas commoda]